MDGGTGVAGGNASVTALSSSQGVSTSFYVFGGQGGAGGAAGSGANGGDGGSGGNASVTLGSLTTSQGSLFAVTGGLGGGGNTGVVSGNGGSGGNVAFSIGTLTMNGQSVFRNYGGDGNAGNVSGNGGDVLFNANSITMETEDSINLVAGNGNLNNTSGSGGSVTVSIGSMSMGVSSAFSSSGGGSLDTGGDASVTVDSLTMGANSVFGVTANSGGSAGLTIGTLNGSGSINVSTGNLQLQDGLYNGIISTGTFSQTSGAFVMDGGMTVTAANLNGGTFTLGDTGPATAYLNGSVTVGPGANLAGYGNIHGAVTNNGQMTPGGGASLGSFTVAQFNQSSTGQLNLGLMPGNFQSDYLIATGAGLDGTLSLDAAAGNYGFRDRYLVLSGASSITGTFSTIINPVSGMTPTVLYGGNAVTLVLLKSGVNYSAYALTPNEIAVAGALDQSLLTCSDSMIAKLSEVYGLPSGQKAVLDQMAGVVYLALPSVLLDNTQFEDDFLFNRLDSGGAGGGNLTKASMLGGIISSAATSLPGRRFYPLPVPRVFGSRAWIVLVR